MAPRAGSKKAAKAEAGNITGDNRPTREEAEALFIRHMIELRGHDSRLATAMETVKAIRKGRTIARNLAKQETEIPLTIFDARLKNEKLTRADLALYEKQWLFTGEALGQPTYKSGQLDLFSLVEDTDKTDEEWFEEGYAACMANKTAEPQKFGVPPDKFQVWMKGHLAAQEKIAWAMSDNGVNPDKVLAPADDE